MWKYTPREAGFLIPFGAYVFYSGFVSSVQRLPNENTLITEGASGRIFEVTKEHEIVWEYLSPYRSKGLKLNLVYRAYRLPYEWVPQVDKPEEKAIQRIDNNRFRVPGSPRRKNGKMTTIKGRQRASYAAQSCVLPE